MSKFQSILGYLLVIGTNIKNIYMNWEYLHRYIPSASSNNLNELGCKGWELCASKENIYFFKRPMKCKNCKHYKRSFTICYGQGFTLKNENCMRDSNTIKCVKADNNGCEHFKSKDND